MYSEIKDLEKVLILTKKSGKKITSCATKPLTAPGENYGSKMLAVQLIIDKIETVDLVAKLPPPNEWIKKMFQVPITFKKEVAMYETIFPLLRTYQQERGMENLIDFYPRFYGARISLDSNAVEVDDDAVILLENLKMSGYDVVDRLVGFDLPTTELILSKLAVFHAIPIALKSHHPDLFNNKIMPYCLKLPAFEAISEETEKLMITPILEAMESDMRCSELTERVQTAFELGRNVTKKSQQTRELYATINHCDYWVNNMMISFKDGHPIDVKMVDFQIFEYGSLARDLVFFLFTSVQNKILATHYDHLIGLYYKNFIATLDRLEFDTSQYTFDSFEKELEIEAKVSQFFHVLVMLKPIFSIKGMVKELSEMTEADMLTNDALSDIYKQKACDTVLEFAQRNWI